MSRYRNQMNLTTLIAKNKPRPTTARTKPPYRTAMAPNVRRPDQFHGRSRWSSSASGITSSSLRGNK